MKTSYRLQITFEENLEKFNALSSIFEVQPINFEDKIYTSWIYESEENGHYFDFVNFFIDLIELKNGALQKLGIERNNISLWLLYEYDQQCNMEFDPTRLKRIADNEITLCISCWENSKASQ
ncbi:hypothetical protein [Kaistella pullorum]|uniref:Uncharacterized protein n=1 Tax=Kaistella pullorum TaxID=2763074 RepID=A0ABR8WPU7_9FLAO|nr:hypothetical protein [Kaistella pullorum]MBD8019109.1 hypothetical protein [Kaistella pullorum]